MKSIASNKTTVHELALIIIIIGEGAKTCLIVVCLITLVMVMVMVMMYVLVQLMYNTYNDLNNCTYSEHCTYCNCDHTVQ
jgi:uncharacterized membrane protein YhaH (DUF805 family)